MLQQSIGTTDQDEAARRYRVALRGSDYLSGNQPSDAASSYARPFSSGRSKPLSFSEPQLSVDQIISDGYLMIPMADPVTAMLFDKQHATWLGVDDAVAQVSRRHDLYKQHLREILQHEADTLSAMLAFPKIRELVAPEIYQSVQKQLQDLSKQRREERTNFWRDVSRLRAGVPELLENYLVSHRKSSLFDGDGLSMFSNDTPSALY